jgi:hypothetical protein
MALHPRNKRPIARKMKQKSQINLLVSALGHTRR